MCEVAISIPNEVLYDTKMSKNDALLFVKRAVALCYYTQNKVSLGYCAQIAGMTKESFGIWARRVFQFSSMTIKMNS